MISLGFSNSYVVMEYIMFQSEVEFQFFYFDMMNVIL